MYSDAFHGKRNNCSKRIQKKVKSVILRSIKIPIHIPYFEPCQTSIMDLFYDNSWLTLHEKCPYSELFWSGFSLIWTEYWEIRSISLYSVRMRGNADQNNSEYGHLLRSVPEKAPCLLVPHNFSLITQLVCRWSLYL